MRTTMDLDLPVLRAVQQVAKQEGKSVGQTVSELLALALRMRSEKPAGDGNRVSWIARPMGARVDLDDREALYAAMDEPEPGQRVAEDA